MSATESVTLDRQAVTAVDAADLVTDVLGIPEYLRDALWKVESAGMRPWESPGGRGRSATGCRGEEAGKAEQAQQRLPVRVRAPPRR